MMGTLAATMRALRRKLATLVGQDKVVFLEDTAASLAQDANRGDTRQAWRGVKLLTATGGRRWASRCQPARWLADGSLAEARSRSPTGSSSTLRRWRRAPSWAQSSFAAGMETLAPDYGWKESRGGNAKS